VRDESGAVWLAERFELSVGRAFQQPLAGAEQKGDEVQPQLVDQAGGKVLVHGRGAAGDCQIALAGRRACPFERCLAAIGRLATPARVSQPWETTEKSACLAARSVRPDP